MSNSPNLPLIDSADSNGAVDPYSTSSTLTNGLPGHVEKELSSSLDTSTTTPPSLPQNPSSSNHSSMSINRICNDTETYPEADDVRSAAEALENLKRGPIDASSHPTTLEPQPNITSPPQNPTTTENGFISRLPTIPIVRKTMDFYQAGKEHSPLLKYGAERIESSIKAISSPLSRISQIEQWDEYACRGLDKLEEKFPNVMEPNSNVNKDPSRLNTPDQDSRRRTRSELSPSSSPSHRSPSRPHRTSQSNGSANYSPYLYPNNNSVTSTSSAAAPLSRWQKVLMGTGAVVGGVGAAVSEESMKSLKYCLHWLRYANQHIEHQISILREFILSLTGQSSGALIHSSAATTLASIKREVVETLRKVIEVVSKYAGACLPEQAKINVRSFILNLPSRWASINRTEHSATPSPLSSPQLPPANMHPINQTTDYAHRLLNLATESLEMLKAVAGIFGDTVERAESIVVKFRSVGVTSGGAAASGDLHFDSIPQIPPTWSSKSPNGYYTKSTHSGSTRSRRSSAGVRMNHPTGRKHSRPTPVHRDDDEDIFHDDEFSSSSESEAENKRMVMDERNQHNLNAHTARSNSSSTTKKRSRKAMKESVDTMDMSEY